MWASILIRALREREKDRKREREREREREGSNTCCLAGFVSMSIYISPHLRRGCSFASLYVSASRTTLSYKVLRLSW